MDKVRGYILAKVCDTLLFYAELMKYLLPSPHTVHRAANTTVLYVFFSGVHKIVKKWSSILCANHTLLSSGDLEQCHVPTLF